MNIKTINPYTNKKIKTYVLHSSKQVDRITQDVYES